MQRVSLRNALNKNCLQMLVLIWSVKQMRLRCEEDLAHFDMTLCVRTGT